MSGRKHKAFTLIELLVVVAIIALLISILLPSLRDAREQAKVAKCLAGYRQLNTTAVQYFLDNQDDFPFWDKDPASPYHTGICSWRFGGATPNDYWRSQGIFYVRAKDRPFNDYLLGGKMETDLEQGTTMIKRAEVPVLRCPSDTKSHQRGFGIGGDYVVPLGAYEDVGSSYQYNMHVFDMHGSLIWGGANGSPCDLWDSSPTQAGDWQEVGKVLVKQVLSKHSSTFVMFIEDSMDIAIDELKTSVGNHGKVNKHAMGYLDGHADYKTADTRGYCGVGWAAINPEWVRRVGAGAYVPTPVSYASAAKPTCNPPKNQ
jgi:prepilin-type N-terminal cleavage/methylation domain-containing protein